jgi:flagellar L-ring protein precursor FlgH
MKKCLGIFLGVLFCINFGSAVSLWGENSKSPMLKNTRFSVGDTITIVVEESLNAAQSGSTRSNKSDDIALNFANRAENSSSAGGSGSRSNIDNRLNFLTSGRSNYSGTGRTTRETSIKTTITATVIDIQPNGNLFVLGQRSIKVNEEVETLEVSGIVNTDRLSDDNIISSTQIANAKITIKGAGTVSTPQSPGVLSRMFDWLF